MDESRLAELKRRRLDFMECTLAEFGTYDFKVEMLGDNLKRHPDRVPAAIVASESDPLVWDVLHRLVPLLWRNERVLPAVLLEWWMDKTTGIRDRPRSGGEGRNQMRDLVSRRKGRNIRVCKGPICARQGRKRLLGSHAQPGTVGRARPPVRGPCRACPPRSEEHRRRAG